MSDRYTPRRAGDGSVYQAGLDTRQRGQQRPYETTRAPYRAVVTETYVSDSEGLSEIGFVVEADVVLVRSGQKITRVPVMSAIGVNDARPWVPRKTTRTLSNNQPLNIDTVISRRGSFVGLATVLDDIDGDVVLLDFIEGDFRFPIVRGAYPHRSSKRTIVEGDGWEEGNDGSERGQAHDQEHYFRYAGAEARVNDHGDVLIDTVGATNDKINETPSNDRGQVRVRVKESQRLTIEMDGTDVLEVWKDGSQVKIDLGEGAAQRLILGDDFRTFLNNFLSTKFDSHTHLAGTLVIGMSAVTGATGVPGPSFLGTQMGTDVLSDLARTKKT